MHATWRRGAGRRVAGRARIRPASTQPSGTAPRRPHEERSGTVLPRKWATDEIAFREPALAWARRRTASMKRGDEDSSAPDVPQPGTISLSGPSDDRARHARGALDP